jgi:hypothetical protein
MWRRGVVAASRACRERRIFVSSYGAFSATGSKMNVRALPADIPTRNTQWQLPIPRSPRVAPQLHVPIRFKFNCIKALPCIDRIVVMGVSGRSAYDENAVGRGELAADAVRST